MFLGNCHSNPFVLFLWSYEAVDATLKMAPWTLHLSHSCSSSAFHALSICKNPTCLTSTSVFTGMWSPYLFNMTVKRSPLLAGRLYCAFGSAVICVHEELWRFVYAWDYLLEDLFTVTETLSAEGVFPNLSFKTVLIPRISCFNLCFK